MTFKNSKTEVPNAGGAVSAYLAAIGRKGGASGTGKSKARSKSQARKAAQARWKKYRESDALKSDPYFIWLKKKKKEIGIL